MACQNLVRIGRNVDVLPGMFSMLLPLVVDKLLDIAADIWRGLGFRWSSGATAAAVAV